MVYIDTQLTAVNNTVPWYQSLGLLFSIGDLLSSVNIFACRPTTGNLHASHCSGSHCASPCASLWFFGWIVPTILASIVWPSPPIPFTNDLFQLELPSIGDLWARDETRNSSAHASVALVTHLLFTNWHVALFLVRTILWRPLRCHSLLLVNYPALVQTCLAQFETKHPSQHPRLAGCLALFCCVS